MAFWSGERLWVKRKEILPEHWDVSIEKPAQRVDCAAYRLTLGEEAFITQEIADTDPLRGIKIELDQLDKQFRIPAGQFAFLLTEEKVHLPPEVIGFISVRSKVKLRGLVNVSGFHVDPGYKGKLIFGVYNAGPTPIHLHRGQPIFLMWCADLECTQEEKAQAKAQAENEQFYYKKDGYKNISSELTSPMTGNVFSPTFLASELKELSKSVADLREKVAFWNRVSWTLLILGAGFVVRYFFWPVPLP